MPPRKLSPFTADGPRAYAGKPLTKIPEPPKWMRTVAQKRFLATCEYLVGIGALTAGEVPMVEAFSAAYGRWVEAEIALAADPITYRSVTNRAGEAASAVALPAQAQASKALDHLRKFAAALGLSPAERGRLPVNAVGDDDDEVERWFRSTGAA
jgi:P27 family predicted phage terminase small subunit